MGNTSSSNMDQKFKGFINNCSQTEKSCLSDMYATCPNCMCMLPVDQEILNLIAKGQKPDHEVECVHCKNMIHIKRNWN